MVCFPCIGIPLQEECINESILNSMHGFLTS